MAYDSNPVGSKTGIPDFPFPSPFRGQIQSGKLCLGTATPATGDLGVVSTIVNKDIDWLWIDCEHGWASPVEGTGAACVLARSRGVAPVIRVAWNDPGLIKKALDMGAVGVMVPQIQNAAEAKAAVDAARYFPEGFRGISPPWTRIAGIAGGMNTEVLKHIQAETVVMVQLESEESYRNLREIAAVPGVDVVMVGPLDLSATVGAIGDTRAPAVLKIMEEVPKILAGTGVACATTLAPYEHHELAVKWGYNILNVGNPLAYGLDVVMDMQSRLREVTRPKL